MRLFNREFGESAKEIARPYYLRWIYFRFRPERKPWYFRQCWRYPAEPLSRLPRSISGLPDLLFLPMNDWHGRMQRTQHLALAFARLGYRCIILNPHLGRQFESTALFDRAARLCRIAPGIFEVHVRLPREPVFHQRTLTTQEESIIATTLRQVLPAGGGADHVQITSFPVWGRLSCNLREQLGGSIVYDCHDLISAFDRVARSIVAEEDALLRQADLVLFSSRELADCHAAKARKWLLVRNAADPAHFRRAGDNRNGTPVVGYAGALESWFDIEAMEAAARRLPGVRFVLVGGIENPEIRRLRRLPNVEFAGEVPYDELPALFSQFRVGLIPFRLSSLTRATNPIKLYEYFACGIPVVSTAMPEVEAMGDLAYIASDASDFGIKVQEALEEADPVRGTRRLELVATENWDNRARTIAAHLGHLPR